MPYTDTVLGAIQGEAIPVRHYYYDDDNDALDVSVGVTFQDDVYDNDHHLATYEHADFVVTGAADGYVDVLISCASPGTWKLMTTTTFTGMGQIRKSFAVIEVAQEGPPTVTHVLNSNLPDLGISATGSG